VTAVSSLIYTRIAADEGRFKNNNEVIINTETRSVEVNKKGIYFAFRDEGACISLLAIKVCTGTGTRHAAFGLILTGGAESGLAWNRVDLVEPKCDAQP
jgi:hypothetical protein